MKGYILALQCCIRSHGVHCSLLTGNIVNDSAKGLRPALDNYFVKLHREGFVSRSHNTISLNDLKTIFRHFSKTSSSPFGYAARVIFAVGLSTGFRPTELHLLTVPQLSKQNIRGETCYLYHEILGGTQGQSKTKGSGLKNVGVKPRAIPINDRAYLEGESVNFYRIIDEYMQIRRSMTAETDRFFLGINEKTKSSDPVHIFETTRWVSTNCEVLSALCFPN